VELESLARKSHPRRRSPNMQRNNEELLHEISIGMEPEDGVIRVYGIGEHGIMAFTDEGTEELKKLLEMHRENPDPFK
jgi:predicted metal-dependent TIM-barrel fold hydrolase